MLTDQKHLSYRNADEISDISRDEDEVELGTVKHTGASEIFESNQSPNDRAFSVKSLAGNQQGDIMIHQPYLQLLKILFNEGSILNKSQLFIELLGIDGQISWTNRKFEEYFLKMLDFSSIYLIHHFLQSKISFCKTA